MTTPDNLSPVRQHETNLQRLLPLWHAERQRAFEAWAYSETWPHPREWRSPLLIALSDEMRDTLNALDNLCDGHYTPPEPIADALRAHGIQPEAVT